MLLPHVLQGTFFNWLDNTIKQKVSCQWGTKWCISAVVFESHSKQKMLKLSFFLFHQEKETISLFFILFVVLSVNSDFKASVFHKTLLMIFFPRPCNHFFRLYFFLIDLLSFLPKASFLFFSLSFGIQRRQFGLISVSYRFWKDSRGKDRTKTNWQNRLF